MLRTLTGIVLAASLAPWVARANPITFNFTGTVTQVPIDDLGTGIQPLHSITGSFTFDSAAVDAIAAPTSASYTSTGPAFGISATIGPSAIPFQVSGSLNIGILNSFVDQYTVLGSSPMLTLNLFFQDSSGGEFLTDALPLSPPVLAGFVQREFHLDQTDAGGNETQVDGNIASLTCGDGCVAQATPEPSSAVLVLLAAILSIAWRLRILLKFENLRCI